MTLDWKCKSFVKTLAISRTRGWKGNVDPNFSGLLVMAEPHKLLFELDKKSRAWSRIGCVDKCSVPILWTVSVTVPKEEDKGVFKFRKFHRLGFVAFIWPLIFQNLRLMFYSKLVSTKPRSLYLKPLCGGRSLHAMHWPGPDGYFWLSPCPVKNATLNF